MIKKRKKLANSRRWNPENRKWKKDNIR